MRLATVSTLVVLVLAAVAPASAEESAAAADLATLAAAAATPAAAGATGAGGCGWPDLAPALVADPVEASTSGVCTATCHDGSSRTCSGTSCSAVDSACPSQQGYCWSNAEGYKYCPTCPVEDCEHDGEPCVKDLQCGTCFGFQCVCRGTVGNKHCICP
jgi:hypothetical protein